MKIKVLGKRNKERIIPIIDPLKNQLFKYQELKREIMGFKGLGATDGEGFSTEELTATEEWLHTKATTIYGGSNEIQANIISKRVLGLPD